MTRPLILIGLSGLMGAGKSTISKEFARQGFTHVRLGEFFKTLARRENSSFEEYIKRINKNLGEEGKAKLILEHLRKVGNKSKGLIIESIYSQPLIFEIKKEFPRADFYLITIEANKQLRIRRVVKRENISKKVAKKKVFYWDTERTKLGMRELRSISNIILKNENTSESKLAKEAEKHMLQDQRQRLARALSKKTHRK